MTAGGLLKPEEDLTVEEVGFGGVDAIPVVLHYIALFQANLRASKQVLVDEGQESSPSARTSRVQKSRGPLTSQGQKTLGVHSSSHRRTWEL